MRRNSNSQGGGGGFILLLALGVGFYFYGDKLSIPDFSPSSPVVIEKEVSEEAKQAVSPIVELVNAHSLPKDRRVALSKLFYGAADVLSVSNQSLTQQDVRDYNTGLIQSYAKLYPEIAGSLPGFTQELTKVLNNEITKYDRRLEPSEVKKLAETYYGVAWAFLQ